MININKEQIDNFVSLLEIVQILILSQHGRIPNPKGQFLDFLK